MYKFPGNEKLNFWMMTIGNLLPSKDKVITLQSIDTVSTQNEVINVDDLGYMDFQKEISQNLKEENVIFRSPKSSNKRKSMHEDEWSLPDDFFTPEVLAEISILFEILDVYVL